MLKSILSLTLLGALAIPALAQELRIRPDVIVNGDVVRLDHLIEGIGARGELPLFRAPVPGTRGTIRAERIRDAAREMGITDIAIGDLRMVTIYRPGRIISREEMQDTIARMANERGTPKDVSIILDDQFPARPVDAHRTEGLMVTGFTRDPRNGRFEARLALPGAKDLGESWLVAGSILETREIAVPLSDLDRGDAIQAKDLVLVKRPAGQVASDVIAPINDLIGMIPRRVIRAGEAIRQADIAKPLLVEKNQIVTVVYEAGGITLSMRGRAGASGAQGDVIKVFNPQSKRTVEGTITGLAKVTVTGVTPSAEIVAEAPRQQPARTETPRKDQDSLRKDQDLSRKDSVRQ